jgi:calcineurin-like phosphoesterase family protein
MRWFTSDLHLGHDKIIDFCERPYPYPKEMDESLIWIWNQLVDYNDMVYVLGDVSFHRPSTGVSQLSRLKGRKILIQGNHDNWSLTQYQQAGFDAVLQEARIRLGGYSVTLSHYPYMPGPEETDPRELRYPERRPLPRGDGWLLCGHVHRKWRVLNKQINVGVDVWDFAPVSEVDILSTIMKREKV